MQSDHRISVCIVTYNFGEFISECIESILAQTLKPAEIVIADDCSADNSWEIIQKYCKRLPDLIRAFRQDRNVGPQCNGAVPFENATGDFLSFIDGDDRWLPAKLETEMMILNENPSVGTVYSNVIVIDAQGRAIDRWNNGASGQLFEKALTRQIFANSGNLLRNELTRKKVYDDIGYTDSELDILIDYDLKLRKCAHGPVICTGEHLVEYRLHDGGIHNRAAPYVEKDNLTIFKKMLHVMDKHPEIDIPSSRKYIENQVQQLEPRIKYKLTYHVSYSDICQREVGFKDKDVLEVGGSLPKEFVFEYLGVNSWTGLESPEYAQWGIEELGRNPNEGDHGTTIGDIDGSTEAPVSAVSLAPGSYNLHYLNIEELTSEHYGQYDLVFSIAAFEHILKFPQAIDKMYMALKPGGQLFTMFSPIWSAHNGHHLPEIKDLRGKIFDFNNSPIPPWGHILMQPHELHRHLLKYTDKETADRMIYLVYTSSLVNRYHTEDFVGFIENSNFVVNKLEGTFAREIDKQTQKRLEAARPGRKHFSNNGICAILTRPRK